MRVRLLTLPIAASLSDACKSQWGSWSPTHGAKVIVWKAVRNSVSPLRGVAFALPGSSSNAVRYESPKVGRRWSGYSIFQRERL